jgi:hypothetical protein
MQVKLFGLLASASLLLACSDEPVATSRHGNPGASDPASAAGAAGQRPSAGPTGPSCPSDLVAPTTLATDIDANDIHIAADGVYFRTGTKVVRVGRDGSARTDVYTSKDLVRAFTDGKTVAAVEGADPANAVVRVGAVGADPANAAQIGTNLVAAGTDVFGADATNLYATGENDGGDTLYKIARNADAPALETVAETPGVITSPQVVGDSLWYVKDQTEIYKVAVTGGDPTLVVSVPAGCSLAVGTTHLYCSTNGALEQRDLTGANPKTLFDVSTSKVPVGFGAGIASGDTVVVGSPGDGPLKSVLRSVAGGTESVIACGRGAIVAMAVDGSSVAWVEQGKGVFLAPLAVH